jgi:hypothetical protein
MIVFVSATSSWVSLGAALAAGVTCLLANSMTRTLLSQTAGANQASVMAVWAIAWAGSKPLASLADGFLAGWIGVPTTGILLTIPAFMPIAVLAVRACRPKPQLPDTMPPATESPATATVQPSTEAPMPMMLLRPEAPPLDTFLLRHMADAANTPDFRIFTTTTRETVKTP